MFSDPVNAVLRALMWLGFVGVFIVAASRSFGAVPPIVVLAMETAPGSCVGPDPEAAQVCRRGAKVDTDQFRYEVCDDKGACSCATVTIEITCSKGQGKGGRKK